MDGETGGGGKLGGELELCCGRNPVAELKKKKNRYFDYSAIQW